MAVLVGASDNNESIVREFIEYFDIIALNDEISEMAVALKR